VHSAQRMGPSNNYKNKKQEGSQISDFLNTTTTLHFTFQS
jgi:hypothetical protein